MRFTAMAGFSVLLGFALVAAPVRAEDAPPAKAPAPKRAPPLALEPAADAVLAAVNAKDDGALKALAALDSPDPWAVTDELLHRGEKDAALAFARASPRPLTARIPAYVELRWDSPSDGPARRAFVTARTALRGKKPDEALAAADAGKPYGDDVQSILLLGFRAAALLTLKRDAESLAALSEAAERASRIGALGLEAIYLGQFGEQAMRAGDLRGARTKFERTVEIRVVAGLKGGIIGTRLLLAMVLDEMGEQAKAREQAEAALKIAEETDRPSEAAKALGILGTVCDSLSDFGKALEYEERSLALAQAAGDRHSVASTLGNMGSTLLHLGNPVKALERFRSALATMNELGDQVNSATLMASIGAVLQVLGDYPGSIDAHDRAIEIYRVLGDSAGESAAQINLARTYRMIGDDEKAEGLLTEGLAKAQASGMRRTAASALSSLGEIAQAQGDHAKARSYFTRYQRTAEDLGDKSGGADALLLLGGLAALDGRLDDALAAFSMAATTAASIGDRSLEVGALTSLADAQRIRGELATARATAEKAVRFAERLRSGRLQVVALISLAQAALAAAEPAVALATVKRSMPLIEELSKRLSDEAGSKAREKFADAFEIGVRAAVQLDNVAEASYFLEAGRAASLLESLEGREALFAASLPGPLGVREQAARAEEIFARASYGRALDGGDRLTIAASAKALDAAQNAIDAVRQDAQREAKNTARVFYPTPEPIEDLQALLADGDALVVYETLDIDDTAWALVATRKDARLVALGNSTALAAACAAIAAQDLDVDGTAAMAALRKIVIAPFGLPKGTRRVLVSPDGPLTFVPPALLFGGGTPGRDGLDVCCVPSGTVYGSLVEDHAPRGEKVVALGDPDYGTPIDARAASLAPAVRGGLRLTPLPATRAEAKAVGDVVLLGAQASETGLTAALATATRWRAVHLACHGLVRLDKPGLSSLALTPSEGHSGFLTQSDVFRMRIPADLVVLSACETGKGKVVRGEGIVGLTRAFMFAGSSRVICSLWKVDDEATSALMVKFYELWNPKDGKPGLPTAEALRKAQEFVKSQGKWKHPYYWAARVLWGLPS